MVFLLILRCIVDVMVIMDVLCIRDYGPISSLPVLLDVKGPFEFEVLLLVVVDEA